MRTYGRIADPYGGLHWVEVTTDDQGLNDNVYTTALIQCFKLNLGESPFYADYGIPAHPSVVQQVFPDFYVYRTQQRFAPYFASLTIAKAASTTPTYNVNILFHNGATVPLQIIPSIPLTTEAGLNITDQAGIAIVTTSAPAKNSIAT